MAVAVANILCYNHRPLEMDNENVTTEDIVNHRHARQEQSMNVKFRPALASLLAVLFLACAVRAQVLNQVPDDALLVIKTKDMSATSTKVGKWLKDLGLAQMKPGLDNPLGLLQKELGLTNGLNTNGEMAIVFRDPAKTNEKGDKSMMLLLPVSDYAGFVANFKDAKVDGEVTEVSMPKGKDPGYLAHWGDYAVLSPSKAVASMKPSAMLKISGAATTKELGTKDIVVYANFNALRGLLVPQLQQVRDKTMEEMENNLGGGDEKLAKFKPVIKSFVGQLFAGAEAFLRDTDAVTFSVDFGNEGLNVAAMAEFIPNSYLGTTFASTKNTNEPLLAGLPTGKYLFFGGHLNQPEFSTRFLSDFSGPILKELDTLGPDMKPAHDYMDALNAYLKALKSARFGIVAPAGQLGQEAIFQMVNISKGDAAAMKDAQIKMIKAQEATMKALGLPADAYSATVVPNSKTIEGVSFDAINTSVNPNNKDPMAMQQAQIMAMVYGPGGMSMLEGKVSDDTLLLGMGVTDDVLKSTITATKTNESPLANSAAVKLVQSHLPTNRTAEFYVPVDQIVTTGLTYARQFGAQMNLTLQPDLPPLGFASSTDGSAIRIDGFVPTVLVQQLVSAGMQAYMQSQGGGGGGL